MASREKRSGERSYFYIRLWCELGHQKASQWTWDCGFLKGALGWVGLALRSIRWCIFSQLTLTDDETLTIFVAHSMGGLVVKKVVRTSKLTIGHHWVSCLFKSCPSPTKCEGNHLSRNTSSWCRCCVVESCACSNILAQKTRRSIRQKIRNDSRDQSAIFRSLCGYGVVFLLREYVNGRNSWGEHSCNLTLTILVDRTWKVGYFGCSQWKIHAIERESYRDHKVFV